MCGREDPTLSTTEVPLYGGHDRIIVKYKSSFNTISCWKITGP